MNDASKTKEQLLDDLARIRSRVAELEAKIEQGVAETQRQAILSERHTIELSIVNEIGRAISSTVELDNVLEVVYQQVGRLFDVANFCISIYEEESDEWSSAFFVEGGQVLPRSHIRHEGGAGLTGCMIRDRQSLLFRSEEEIAAFQKARGQESIGESALSWLGVPLVVADKVVGGMAIQSYERENLYDEHDETLFFTIATQVASAVNNLRLLKETQQSAEELAVLNELSRALTTCFTVEEVLEQTYQGASLLLDTTNFDLGLYDSHKNEVTFVYNITESVIDRQITTISADQGITGHIVRNRVPVLIQDDLNEWLVNAGIEAVGEPALSWLGVPMMVGDQVLGVMTVQSYTTPHLYDEHDQELLVAVGNQAAIALQNAQMMASLEQKIEEGMAELRNSLEERERLQQEVIEAQKQTLQELSTPIIPVMDRIIVVPLIGNIDAMRARDITRRLLAGIREHRAKVVILDITGVSVVDGSVADHLNKTIQAARLKGSHTIVTGISDAVAGTIVDLGIDWSGVETLQDMQTGLMGALGSLGFRLTK